MSLVAPFPWFGNKAAVADVIVSRLLHRGPISQYIEPFAGGLAVMLKMPTDVYRLAGDFDGVLVNIWRAICVDPEAVAAAADIQASGAALVATHRELAKREGALLPMLCEDLDAYDARAAGLRLFAMGNQLNHGHIPTHPDRVGMFATGPSRLGADRVPTIENLMRIRDALRCVRILHGDWRTTLTDSCLKHRPPDTVAVMLDSPYSEGDGAYRHCSTSGEPSIAQVAAQWAREHPELRIALCGEASEHEMPGWYTYEWKRPGKSKRCRAECIWFSPGCGPGPEKTGQEVLF